MFWEQLELVRQYYGMTLEHFCFELLSAGIHALQRSPQFQVLHRKSLLYVRIPILIKLWQKPPTTLYTLVSPDFISDALGLLAASQFLFDTYVFFSLQ